jgi:hydroxymethylpyrimidine/phosphomethylpyrimidine kinase
MAIVDKRPVALTIAGSDSGGGAGIQADLKAFAARGVFGTSALTCLTAQNPDEVTSVVEVSVSFIESQILTVLSYFPVQSAKTGMLFSEPIISKVSEILQSKNSIQLVVDPVMVSTSGSKLLLDSAIQTMKDKLIPLAAVITPNLDEASILLDSRIESVDDMKDAAISLFKIWRVPVLMKGGHLKNQNDLSDILYDGKSFHSYVKPLIPGVNTHGTGCTYSSAISAELAKGKSLPEAVGNSRDYLHKCLEQSYIAGKSSTINHFPI